MNKNTYNALGNLAPVLDPTPIRFVPRTRGAARRDEGVRKHRNRTDHNRKPRYASKAQRRMHRNPAGLW